MIRDYLKYDPETGDIVWIKKRKNINRGDIAGTLTGVGYRVIQLNDKQHKAHRLAWYLYYGDWPNKALDHINGDKGDNRISNLREVTNQQNQANTGLSVRNTSGYKGVHWFKSKKKWRAQIQVSGDLIFLGYFDDIKQAAKAYSDTAKEWYGEFNRKVI